MPTYLQLPQNQGGTRFGPFPGGVVQLGTAQGQCQVVLAPGPGLAPVHAQILDLGTGKFTVQPVQADAPLFLVQRGQTQLWPVNAPVTASAGDTVILGGPNGPRFQLQWEAGAAGGQGVQGPTAGAAGAAMGAGLAGGIARELKRQAFARQLAKAGPLRDAYHFVYRLRSGALTNPRVLIGLLGTVAGVLFMLGTSCLGFLGMLWQNLSS